MDTVNIEISKNIVEPIIEAKIKAVIIEAMGAQDELIGRVVQEVLNRKVDIHGKVSSYNSQNKYPYIQTALSSSLNAAVKEAINEYIGARQVEIKQELLKALDTKKIRNVLITAMVDGFVNQAKSPEMAINFTFPEVKKTGPMDW